MTADVNMLATFLNVTDIDTDRAELLLSLATDKCLGIVDPLPDGSDGVVLDIAARAYTNPSVSQFQAPGPYQPGGPPTMGGLWMTKANIAELRRLAPTGSGAYSVDMTPVDAGAGNYWGQLPVDPSDPWTNPPFYGDWDQIPSA
jgi:hypothetical protein